MGSNPTGATFSSTIFQQMTKIEFARKHIMSVDHFEFMDHDTTESLLSPSGEIMDESPGPHFDPTMDFAWIQFQKGPVLHQKFQGAFRHVWVRVPTLEVQESVENPRQFRFKAMVRDTRNHKYRAVQTLPFDMLDLRASVERRQEIDFAVDCIVRQRIQAQA